MLLLLLLQKKCEYHRSCCDYLVAAACQDGSAWNERKKLHFYQLVIYMVWDLWISYARTFRCLALLWWERTSGKDAMWAIVGSNLYCSLFNSKSPLMCVVGKQQKYHMPRSLNYCCFVNELVLFFVMPFLAHKDFALTSCLKTAKCECLWSSVHCEVRMFVKQG